MSYTISSSDTLPPPFLVSKKKTIGRGVKICCQKSKKSACFKWAYGFNGKDYRDTTLPTYPNYRKASLFVNIQYIIKNNNKLLHNKLF